MPFHHAGGLRLFYRVDDRPDRPLLVLGNSLGTDMFMWQPQMAALTAHYRVLRIDTRGHGASDVRQGDARIEDLAQDLLAVADALRADRFAFCGLSLGAMVGQWLAIHQPQRLTRLEIGRA